MSFTERITLPQRCIRSKYCWWFLLLLLWGGLILALVLYWIWWPQPDKDPRIQTPLDTSLQLDIPEDHHYTYICLHHDGWSGCIQLNQMHRGNMTFSITAERTTSEAHHDQSKTMIAGFLVAFSTAFMAIGICMYIKRYGIACWGFYQGFCTSTTKYYQNDDHHEHVVHMDIAPPPKTEKVGHSCADNIISQINPSFDAGPEFIGTVDGQVKELRQEATIKATSNCSSEGCPQIDSIYVMEDPPPQSKEVRHSGVNIIRTQAEVHVPSTGEKLQGNRTIWNVKIIDKKIDSHNGSPGFIQAMSDKMEDMKNQVKAVTSAFDEPIISKGYDFFIIYCGKNSAVVNGIIIPRLKELNITYCEHQEHFIPGRDIFTNIQDCISQSRKILAVFSEDFFASDWCRKDLDMAMVQATEKQIVHFIVPFKIDDCVIPDKYGDLKNITYSDLTSYPKDWGEQIRGSLASIRVASMKMEICMCPEHLQKPFNSSTATIWL